VGRAWIALTITCSRDVQELLIPFLWDSGATGFVEEENDFTAYIPAELWKDNVVTQFSQFQDRLRSEGNIITKVQIATIEDRNWNEEWEKTIQPIRVSDTLMIKPSWVPVAPQDGVVVLTINPKMSFGTGYHETTRIMLRMLENVIQPGDRVLDVGTGTGILAIAAVRLGGSSAIGVDNDQWSLDNALENIALNDAASQIEIRTGSIGTIPETDFHIVMANIHFTIIVEMIEELIEHTAHGRHLLLSGVLESDERAIQDVLVSAGCSIQEIFHESEWIGITAVRDRV
jgi:ribosomal protein L11 methyltransferase